MTTLQFATLDPRTDEKNAAIAEANNAKVLGPKTLGIEVTVQRLAARCGLGNIDPQHSGQNVNLAAIEAALTALLPEIDAFLVTVRADLDSVGAMAVLAMRLRGVEFSPDALARITQIAEADRFSRGEYPGAQPLPTKENSWPEGGQLSALAAAVADFKVSMEDRVATMERWILAGEEPETYRAQVEKERADLITALEKGDISYRTVEGRIAVVETTHRAATMVGYSLAPVIVAFNPQFRFQGGEPHAKFTISQFKPGYVDLKAVFAELSELEEGWNGSPTIGGSPQGVASKLTMEQVVAVVQKHLAS